MTSLKSLGKVTMQMTGFLVEFQSENITQLKGQEHEVSPRQVQTPLSILVMIEVNAAQFANVVLR